MSEDVDMALPAHVDEAIFDIRKCQNSNSVSFLSYIQVSTEFIISKEGAEVSSRQSATDPARMRSLDAVGVTGPLAKSRPQRMIMDSGGCRCQHG